MRGVEGRASHSPASFVLAVVAMTNAAKAQLMALAQAILGLLQVFGVALSDIQWGAIETLLAAMFSVWVGMTYQHSRRRRENDARPDLPSVKLLR